MENEAERNLEREDREILDEEAEIYVMNTLDEEDEHQQALDILEKTKDGSEDEAEGANQGVHSGKEAE